MERESSPPASDVLEKTAALVRLRAFVFGLLISLPFAVILTPTEFGTNEYMAAYGFLVACSVILAILARRRRDRRYMAYAVGLILLAPFAPILMAVLLYDLLL